MTSRATTKRMKLPATCQVNRMETHSKESGYVWASPRPVPYKKYAKKIVSKKYSSRSYVDFVYFPAQDDLVNETSSALSVFLPH